MVEKNKSNWKEFWQFAPLVLFLICMVIVSLNANSWAFAVTLIAAVFIMVKMKRKEEEVTTNSEIRLYYLVLLPGIFLSCFTIPQTEKIVVTRNQVVNNWTFRVPAVDTVRAIDKKHKISFNHKMPVTEYFVAEGKFSTVVEIEVIDEKNFIKFVQTDANPNQYIKDCSRNMIYYTYLTNDRRNFDLYSNELLDRGLSWKIIPPKKD